jgi:hypothetical protein
MGDDEKSWQEEERQCEKQASCPSPPPMMEVNRVILLNSPTIGKPRLVFYMRDGLGRTWSCATDAENLNIGAGQELTQEEREVLHGNNDTL